METIKAKFNKTSLGDIIADIGVPLLIAAGIIVIISGIGIEIHDTISRNQENVISAPNLSLGH